MAREGRLVAREGCAGSFCTEGGRGVHVLSHHPSAKLGCSPGTEAQRMRGLLCS